MSVLRQLLINKALNSNKNPLTFTAVQDNSSVKLTKVGSPDQINLLYKLNDNQWTDYTINTVISLNNDDKVSFKGTTNTFSKSENYYYKFVMTGKIKASGNTNSLINYSKLSNYCYTKMFYYCSSLIVVPELPSITMANYCYSNMFRGCTGITSLPQNLLPATKLAPFCYSNMFYECCNLIETPQLPAKIMFERCYYAMFHSCINLTTLPMLPANNNLASNCYNSMFRNCTGLSSIPQNLLISTTLVVGCYSGMFMECTGLSSIPQNLLPSTTLADYCYYQMFSYCTGLTSIPQNLLPSLVLKSHCYNSMFISCINLTIVPKLLSTVLNQYCYAYMFSGCSKLSNITVNFTDWNSSNNSTQNWLKNTSSTGTFTCPSSLPQTRGTSYIPQDWTIVTK